MNFRHGPACPLCRMQAPLELSRRGREQTVLLTERQNRMMRDTFILFGLLAASSGVVLLAMYGALALFGLVAQ